MSLYPARPARPTNPNYVGSECPHLICYAHFKSTLDFRAHFKDVHYIEEPRSNYVSRKRKSDHDEQNDLQDTKGEALNHVSEKAKNGDEKGEGGNSGPTLYIIDET